MSSGTTQEFTGWRAYLWPIHNHELRKLLPMLLILFLITVDYNILRTMKDTLVVATGKQSGAEVIPFIKVWVMFPGAILMTYLFTRLSNSFKRETVFYLILGVFLSYFLFFVIALYPNRELIHPEAFSDKLQAFLPHGLKGFVAMIRNWSFTSFYVMAELWSNIVLFLLFWGFANQVTHLGEAKRFYAILGIATNISGIFAGQLAVSISKLSYITWVPYGKTAWDQQMLFMVMIIVVCGFSAMAMHRWMHTHILDEETGETVADSKGEVRGKMSMRDNFSYLLKSRYLLNIAVLVVAYNMIINLVEVPWKHQVKELYPNPSDFSLYMNRVMMSIGIIATITSFCMTGNIIRIFGWKATAMLTPLLLLGTSVMFFTALFLKDDLHLIAEGIFGMTPLTLVVFLGTLQNCISRGAKYTIYDATKEMAFIPLSQESKLKGKAAIDGVCSRLGKSGGSVVHQSLFVASGSITSSLPYLTSILGGVLLIWLFAVRSLGNQFNALTDSQEPQVPLTSKPIAQS